MLLLPVPCAVRLAFTIVKVIKLAERSHNAVWGFVADHTLGEDQLKDLKWPDTTPPYEQFYNEHPWKH